MNKYFFLLAWFLVSIRANSQDTLFLNPTGKLIVIVKEVSETDIRYKKVEMPDGAMYVIGKTNVAKIIYGTGYTEVISPADTNPFVIKSEAPVARYEKITLKEAKRSQYALTKLISLHPDPAKRERLTTINLRIQSLKRKERGAAFSTAAVGAVAGFGFLLYSGGMNMMSIDSDDLIIPPLIISGVAAVLGTTAIVVHVSIGKKQKKFVKLYNE